MTRPSDAPLAPGRCQSLIPGPVTLRPEVLAELGSQVEPHYGPKWTAFFREVQNAAKRVLRTTGRVFLLPGSGSAAIDAAIGSRVGERDGVLVLVNGFFGERLAEVARTHTKLADAMAFPYDRPIDPTRLDAELRGHRRPELVTAVHVESSSGLLNPIRELAAVCQRYGISFMVDAISSLGGVEFAMDAWGIGICVSASQKCLEGAPGLGLVGVGPNEWPTHFARRAPRGWYLSLQIWDKYEDAWGSWHPHPVTMPVQVVRSLNRGLDFVLAEGLESRWQRHLVSAMWVREQLQSLGFPPVFPVEYASPTVVAAYGSDDISADDLVSELSRSRGIYVSRGMGGYAGRAFRVGNMGPQATKDSMAPLFRALDDVLTARRADGSPTATEPGPECSH